MVAPSLTFPPRTLTLPQPPPYTPLDVPRKRLCSVTKEAMEFSEGSLEEQLMLELASLAVLWERRGRGIARQLARAISGTAV